MTHRPVASTNEIKFVRRTKEKKYEYGYVTLGATRDEDTYRPSGLKDSFSEATKVLGMVPSVSNRIVAGGFHEDLFKTQNESDEQGEETAAG